MAAVWVKEKDEDNLHYGVKISTLGYVMYVIMK